MENIQVGIMMGRASDMPVMEEAAKILKEFGVGHELKVLSAHRTPKETAQYAEEARGRGIGFDLRRGRFRRAGGVVAAHRACRSSVQFDPSSMAWIRFYRQCRCRRVFCSGLDQQPA